VGEAASPFIYLHDAALDPVRKRQVSRIFLAAVFDRALVTSPRSPWSRFDTAPQLRGLARAVGAEQRRPDATVGNRQRDALEHEDHMV